MFPPLHLTLGFIKQFSTAIDKGYASFKYIKDFFPKRSIAKADVFVGSQIKIIMVCKELPKKISMTVIQVFCSGSGFPGE